MASINHYNLTLKCGAINFVKVPTVSCCLQICTFVLIIGNLNYQINDFNKKIILSNDSKSEQPFIY